MGGRVGARADVNKLQHIFGRSEDRWGRWQAANRPQKGAIGGGDLRPPTGYVGYARLHPFLARKEGEKPWHLEMIGEVIAMWNV